MSFKTFYEIAEDNLKTMEKEIEIAKERLKVAQDVVNARKEDLIRLNERTKYLRSLL